MDSKKLFRAFSKKTIEGDRPLIWTCMESRIIRYFLFSLINRKSAATRITRSGNNEKCAVARIRSSRNNEECAAARIPRSRNNEEWPSDDNTFYATMRAKFEILDIVDNLGCLRFWSVRDVCNVYQFWRFSGFSTSVNN